MRGDRQIFYYTGYFVLTCFVIIQDHEFAYWIFAPKVFVAFALSNHDAVRLDQGMLGASRNEGKLKYFQHGLIHEKETFFMDGFILIRPPEFVGPCAKKFGIAIPSYLFEFRKAFL